MWAILTCTCLVVKYIRCAGKLVDMVSQYGLSADSSHLQNSWNMALSRMVFLDKQNPILMFGKDIISARWAHLQTRELNWYWLIDDLRWCWIGAKLTHIFMLVNSILVPDDLYNSITVDCWFTNLAGPCISYMRVEDIIRAISVR